MTTLKERVMVEALREKGLSEKDIAKKKGWTPKRVHQILSTPYGKLE